MPRERIIDGPLWVHYPKGYTEEGDGPTPSARLYNNFVPSDQIPEGSVVIQEPAADLVWRRESRPGDGDGFTQLTVECEAEWLRRRLAEVDKLGDGRWVQISLEVMDRRRLNQLIRLLKRARDAAYGTDE